jgi:hypothetical protein
MPLYSPDTMKTQLVKAGEGVEKGETLALQLEQSRRELDVCRRQLAQMNDLFDAHKRSEALLQGEKNLTEMIARGDSLEAMLKGACRLVEEALPGCLAIILLVDGKRLRRGAAPSFPKYLAEVDGFEINPALGTCAAAAARKEQVITEDITTDPHWVGYLELAARHGLRAGWATPILSSASQALGTFSLYWPQPCSPTPQHLQIINQIARLVAFAIERKRAAEALNASEQVSRGQVEALIYSLDVLATASEPKKFLGKMLSTICRQLSGLSVALWLYDEPTESMTLQLITDATGTFDFHENRLLTKGPLSWGKNSGYQELLFAACPVLSKTLRPILVYDGDGFQLRNRHARINRQNDLMDIINYLRNSEQSLYDFNTPWSMTIVVLGFLSAWLVTNVLENLGVTRHVWHLPLFFAALAVLFGSLIGLFFAP